MVNRQKGQLRIGTSGPINIGSQHSEDIKVVRGTKHGPKVHRKRSERTGQQADIPMVEEPQIMRLESVSFVSQEPFIIQESHKKSQKDIIIEKFGELLKQNKDSGRYWYYGLEGRWWWGMSEEEVRRHLINTESQKGPNIELENKALEKKISQVSTIGEIIDEMKAKYNTELPKDLIKRISYIYPLYGNDSFHIVASNHIKYLRHKYVVDNDNIEIEEIDWSQLSNINWNEKRNILIHPFLHQFSSYESFMQNSRNFAKLLATKQKIGGFDVADSTKISKIAVDLINKIDLMMVPSNFVKDVYIRSGVTIPVEILPHGIPDEFLTDYPTNRSQLKLITTIYTDNVDIIKLRKMKEKGNILILYFLAHSSHRKGADLVKEVMKRIQNKFDNVYLVIKGENKDYFSKIRSVCIESWMSNDNLRLLYDVCDVLLSPSRGGGFELNALEAISRGLPTLVTNGGCFLDLINYFIPITLSDKMVQPLPGNPIHTGVGYDADIDDFEAKLTDVINRLDYWKERSVDNIKDIREKYTWRESARILDQHLKNHGFIG